MKEAAMRCMDSKIKIIDIPLRNLKQMCFMMII